MQRDLLAHLPIVVCVAAHRSFTAAAAALDMSPSAVSHAVRTVENRLGQPLFARTTRSVSLTEVGAQFLASVSASLGDISKAVDGAMADQSEITGLLRINAPRIAYAMGLTAILAKLAVEHPRLMVEVHTNDALIDIVAQRFDAGIRLGAAVQQDMVAVRITAPFKAILVASPDYLRVQGVPASLADLSQHNCIGFRQSTAGSLYEWEFLEDGVPISYKTAGSAVISDATYARDLALASVGIAYIFEPLVCGDIRDGRLQWLLPDTAIEESGLFLYFAQRAQLAPKLRAFIDTAQSLVPS